MIAIYATPSRAHRRARWTVAVDETAVEARPTRPDAMRDARWWLAHPEAVKAIVKTNARNKALARVLVAIVNGLVPHKAFA